MLRLCVIFCLISKLLHLETWKKIPKKNSKNFISSKYWQARSFSPKMERETPNISGGPGHRSLVAFCFLSTKPKPSADPQRCSSCFINCKYSFVLFFDYFIFLFICIVCVYLIIVVLLFLLCPVFEIRP